ncbi:MAG: M48 family metalloprotease, partial [Planctomycetota bacterium]
MLLTFLVSLLIIYIPAASSVGGHPTFLTPLGVAGLVLINGIACWMGTKTALRGGADAAGELRAFKIFKLLKMGVVSFVFIAVFALNWPAYVWTLMGIRGEAVPVLPLVADVIVVLPVLCMIITAMAFRYRYQRVKKGRRLDVSSMIQYLVVRVRTELAILVVPWLLIILFSDLTAIILSESPYFSSIDSAVSLGLLGGLIVLGPSALQYVWDTSSLPDGSLRDRLETLAEREGFGYRDIRLWDTDRHIPNAAVIGPFAPFRYVLMTDALLANCTEREVEGIFAHEV